jgi:hypothetical protein
MTVLNAAELSRLARIASNPKLAREHKSLKSLQGHARNVARALLGETRGVPEEAAKTAGVVKQWTSRQKK